MNERLEKSNTMSELKLEDLKVGQWYRAKNPREVGMLFNRELNDRKILYISFFGEIQYDGPAVKQGAKYPKITVEKFLKWVGHELTTEQMKSEGLMG